MVKNMSMAHMVLVVVPETGATQSEICVAFRKKYPKLEVTDKQIKSAINYLTNLASPRPGPRELTAKYLPENNGIDIYRYFPTTGDEEVEYVKWW